MRRTIPFVLLAPALLLTFLLPRGLAAQSGGPSRISPEEAEAIQRILALEKETAALIDSLSPAAREALERLRQGELPEPVHQSPPPHPAAVPAPAVEPPPPATPPPIVAPIPPPRRGRCNALLAFDDNRDGVIDATDGVWRFLYLWQDRNGDGQVEPKEIDSAFARGVRSIAADLGSFEHKKGWAGDIDILDTVVFDFGPKDRRTLVIEAGDFNRGDGGPKLQGADGKPLTGILPFQGGWRLVSGDGGSVTLDCP